MDKKMIGAWVAVGAVTAMGACVLYWTYYHVRYGPKARTPLGAWYAARKHHDKLDTVLAEILGNTESR